MKKHLNTLFVTTQGAYLAKDGETVAVRIEREVKLRIPVHTLDSIVCFGNVSCSPFLMGFCAERDVTISFLTENGRFFLSPTQPQTAPRYGEEYCSFFYRGYNMFVLVTYDVKTSDPGGNRRLRRVAKACKDYGQRVTFIFYLDHEVLFRKGERKFFLPCRPQYAILLLRPKPDRLFSDFPGQSFGRASQ
jgi:hypothetical protein